VEQAEDKARLSPEPEPASEPAPAAQQPESPPDEAELVRREVQYIVDHLGVRGRIEVARTESGWYANIRSRRPNSVHVGHDGAPLDAVGRVVRLVVARHFPNVPTVTVDIAGYRNLRANFLRSKAIAIARLVLEGGREMPLEPVTYDEMVIVRNELKKIPDVRCHAIGDGPTRDLIISPVRK
jgi:spoIIIJ-associated protein